MPRRPDMFKALSPSQLQRALGAIVAKIDEGGFEGLDAYELARVEQVLRHVVKLQDDFLATVESWKRAVEKDERDPMTRHMMMAVINALPTTPSDAPRAKLLKQAMDHQAILAKRRASEDEKVQAHRKGVKLPHEQDTWERPEWRTAD